MSDWSLPCGCVAALEPVGLRLAWAIVSRCDEHPSGDVPVPSMAFLSWHKGERRGVGAAVEAHYQRYTVSYVQKCPSVDQAFLFLAHGEESGDLSSVKVVDGDTVYDYNDPEFKRRMLAAYDVLEALA